MRVPRLLSAASWLLVLGSVLVWAQDAADAKDNEGAFLVKPYLQPGDDPGRGDLRLLWHADDAADDWAVEYRPGTDRPWRTAEAPSSRRVAVARVAPHRVYRATLKGLDRGGVFTYRVRKGGREVFSAEGRAPRGADQTYRFVAVGDCGAGSDEQKPIAYQAYLARPDFVLIPGDIVYDRGRASEYRERFWPVYNADEASSAAGVPLLRSTLTIAAPGNHDILTPDLEKYPDGLAYFYYWDQPLNGPEGDALVPKLSGPEANQEAFRKAAGPAYPRMANFSFDYGNAHWTVLDSNPYVEWTDRDLRAWVERDLAAARGATWRFVAFHHPGFNSSRQHYAEQQMRVLADLFEAGNVDVVFTGHVHNYQRTYPLRFVPGTPGDDKPVIGKGGKPITGGRLVPGRWTLDKTFDGRTHTRPDGIIYLVTGAGGQHLYNPEQNDDPASWQGFTHKFASKVYSLTVADVDGPRLTVRQVSADGEEIDRFTINRGIGSR
jgi:hypothetical protein